ncbi:putative ascorbate-specific transmembrane electron transporter 1 [Canna indica]|uniref:Ascorbate-specific transmembrane electron transporter 1 n=1 Tax=Canna indica TaxID=4628 RepID=A0AAQ3K8H9_9LILI|nr:putative ascorbate-specific transmembrane electron transporter 1 [Canna indica]
MPCDSHSLLLFISLELEGGGSIDGNRNNVDDRSTTMPTLAGAPVKPWYMVAAANVTKVAHLFALTVFVLVLAWVLHFRGGAARLNSDDPNLIFNVHPLVMCLGFILISGEGIMAYKMLLTTHAVQKSVHMMLHLVALGLGILGIYAAFKYHKANTMPDMVSLHSWLGICTISLFGLQWLIGFASFWLGMASQFTKQMLVPFHKSAGLVIFLIMVCTAETGFVQMDAAPGTESRVVNFTGLFILLFALAVSFSVALPIVLSL